MAQDPTETETRKQWNPLCYGRQCSWLLVTCV